MPIWINDSINKLLSFINDSSLELYSCILLDKFVNWLRRGRWSGAKGLSWYLYWIERRRRRRWRWGDYWVEEWMICLWFGFG